MQTNDGLFYRILELKIKHPECFKPNRNFYKTTGLGQRRFGLLYRGEKLPTEKEIKNFCEFIGCTDFEQFTARQLQIPYK